MGFKLLSECGTSTGDRVWRMPLWQSYKDKMKNSPLADLNNISLTPGGGSCTAAGFLANFTTCSSWMHLDIAGMEDAQSGRVTDLVSFYELPSTIMNHPKYNGMRAAYSYYNVAGSVAWEKLMYDALILAKQL